jgi:hypothetical protein
LVDFALKVIDSKLARTWTKAMSYSWLKYWFEGCVLLSVVVVGTAANFFSVIIIRNRELSLVQVPILQNVMNVVYSYL